MMYYPDWDGTNESCIIDGAEPEYMRANAYGYYLFVSLQDCCEQHFSWMVNECAGTVDQTTAGMFYPDWEGGNIGCLDDGNAPSYMMNNPTSWMHETLEACCTRNYAWNYNTCMGAGGGAAATGTSKWYVDYNDSICVQDCVGSAPCGGLADPWDSLYDDAAKCCSQRLNWIKSTTCEAQSEGTGAAPAGSTSWYADWGAQTCVQDCEGSAPCGGLAQSWDFLYASKSACCSERMSWSEDCQ